VSTTKRENPTFLLKKERVMRSTTIPTKRKRKKQDKPPPHWGRRKKGEEGTTLETWSRRIRDTPVFKRKGEEASGVGRKQLHLVRKSTNSEIRLFGGGSGACVLIK